MKVVIVYPLPFDNWTFFEPFVERFTRTFKQFKPGCEYEVAAVCNWGEPADKVREMFYGIKTKFVPYYENGWDIGSAQHVAHTLPDNVFMVNMTSRCYFHREGWLKLMADAREALGSGLYGCTANHDGYRLHLCTRAYAMDVEDFKYYPHKIDSRAKGPLFEIGADNEYGNLMEWMEVSRGKPSRLVFFDRVAEKPDWFTAPNRFRSGDQSNVLVHDFHTDIYRDAGDEMREILRKNNVEKL